MIAGLASDARPVVRLGVTDDGPAKEGSNVATVTAQAHAARLAAPTRRPRTALPAFIIAWQRHSYRWQASVIWVPNTGQVIQEWVPVDQLGPVPVVEH